MNTKRFVVPSGLSVILPAIVCLVAIQAWSMAWAAEASQAQNRRFTANLTGYNEVHFSAGPPAVLRGAVSTAAHGSFQAFIHDRTQMIEYTLTYDGLEGTVTQAHIHFGQPSTVGGIVVWLCQTTGTLAPLSVRSVTPFCPSSGAVTGFIQPGQVLEVTGQGIAAGEFEELVKAIRADTTYANVHSSLHGPGEIRGQIVSDLGRSK